MGMVSVVTTLVLVIAIFSGFMYVNQPGMIFFPIKELHESPGNWGMQYENLTLETTDKIRLHGWFIPRGDADKTLLFFHGNAGNISHRSDSIKIFHDLGLNVLIFDYRGYGQSEGKPTEEGLYKDARAAWNYLTQTRGINSKNIILFGRSLGGAVAAKLAVEVNAGGVILESTFSSARDMARELFPLLSYLVPVRFDFKTASYIKQVSYPVLVIHSPDDEIIPYSLGRKVYDAANQPKQLLELNGDHNSGFLQSQPRYQKSLDQFIAGIHE
ncbi:MAG: alpha/beta hydrolase [Gammaproteobacteria bacterium]|nr:alpha/beta hydrolase [Gammaproteobacteria bacterium]